MSKLRSTPLKTNPFTTYRDPKTGRWQVVHNDQSAPGRDRSGDAAPHTSDDDFTELERAIAS